jgi:UDP-glucose 4-epimerase
MVKVCVFGGSGFLGSHLADSLTKQGYNVTIFDSQKSSWLKEKQTMVIGDIMDQDTVEKVVKNSEIVYNFAAIADLNHCITEPKKSALVNVIGNINILEACRKHHVKRFVFASSIYVYSGQGGFYKCSKQASESYIEEYQKRFGLDFTILRFGSLYGPRCGEENTIHRMIKKAIEEGIITYNGSPEAVRDYIHVHDAANASVSILSEDFKNKNVILSGQQKIKITELLNMLADILNQKCEIEVLEDEPEGHYVTTPYSFQPKFAEKYVPASHIDLGQGLLREIESFYLTRMRD